MARRPPHLYRPFAVSPFAEIEIIAARELWRTFRSAKGILVALLGVLVGGGVPTVAAWIRRLTPGAYPSDLPQAAYETLLLRTYGEETGHRLSTCPFALWILLEATLWCGPWLVALLAFDGISGDVQHRSVRFWAPRARRSSFVVGKYMGAWLAVLAVTLGIHVVVSLATWTLDAQPLGHVVGWSLAFFLVVVPISAAWCALATLAGCAMRAPTLSLLVIVVAFFGLWLARIVAGLSDSRRWVAFVNPNFYNAYLLSPEPGQIAKGLLGTSVIAAASVWMATLVFARKDL